MSTGKVAINEDKMTRFYRRKVEVYLDKAVRAEKVNQPIYMNIYFNKAMNAQECLDEMLAYEMGR